MGVLPQSELLRNPMEDLLGAGGQVPLPLHQGKAGVSETRSAKILDGNILSEPAEQPKQYLAASGLPTTPLKLANRIQWIL